MKRTKLPIWTWWWVADGVSDKWAAVCLQSCWNIRYAKKQPSLLMGVAVRRTKCKERSYFPFCEKINRKTETYLGLSFWTSYPACLSVELGSTAYLSVELGCFGSSVCTCWPRTGQHLPASLCPLILLGELPLVMSIPGLLSPQALWFCPCKNFQMLMMDGQSS